MTLASNYDYDQDVRAYKAHPERYAIDLLARRVASRLDTQVLNELDLAALRQYGEQETRPAIKAALSVLHDAVTALTRAYRDEDEAGPAGALS